MARIEEIKALSSALTALVIYDKTYGLNKEEQKEFDEAMKKVYNSLIIQINS